MPIFEVRARELVWEKCYIEAPTMDIAEKLARQDELHDWETYDGESFELMGIDKVPEWKIPSICTDITHIDKME